MKFSPSITAVGLFVALAAAAAIPQDPTIVDVTTTDDVVLPLAEPVLTDADVAEYTEYVGFGDSLAEEEETPVTKRSGGRTCKKIPGDSAWPSTIEWAILKFFTGGSVVKPEPIGKVCYAGPAHDASACSGVLAAWYDSSQHVDHPTSIMSPLYQGLSCLPQDVSIAGHTCTIGGDPVYVVNAKSAWDVQAAVNFARNKNIRLVVKNTGHDFAGKSSGSHSLSIRTHLLKDIVVIRNYQRNGYSGPAIKAGSGIQGFELYATAHQAGLVVVGGEGMTVGWGGGYIQGGGHSPLSSIYGMAADHVLAYEVVLANGRFVTADADTNSDLFWALRGGGGSTFGVVISITVKAYPDLPVTISTFTFQPSANDVSKYAVGNYANDDFWAVIKKYFSSFPANADQGIYSYFNIFPNSVKGSQTFTMLPFFAPRKTVAEVTALLKPFTDLAAARGVTVQPNTVAYPGFYEAWQAGFPKELVGMWNGQTGSRLFPRTNWGNEATWNATFDVIRKVTTENYLIGFNIAPTLAAGGVSAGDTAVNPAWRKTVFHAICGVIWDIDARDRTTIKGYQTAFTNGPMKLWRDVSPGAGAYLGEADTNEPNFQQSFFGTNYDRLYTLKQRYDPSGVFFAETAVGSEDWKAGTDRLGRLCPV